MVQTTNRSAGAAYVACGARPQQLIFGAEFPAPAMLIIHIGAKISSHRWFAETGLIYRMISTAARNGVARGVPICT
jgi:hypothetical protein